MQHKKQVVYYYIKCSLKRLLSQNIWLTKFETSDHYHTSLLPPELQTLIICLDVQMKMIREARIFYKSKMMQSKHLTDKEKSYALVFHHSHLDY